MKKFHISQQDPNPSRWVNPGLGKGYPARRVDPGWLLQSCKHLLQIDCTRVDPLRRVEANPGSCKGGLNILAIFHWAENSAQSDILFCLKTNWQRVGAKRQKKISFSWKILPSGKRPQNSMERV